MDYKYLISSLKRARDNHGWSVHEGLSIGEIRTDRAAIDFAIKYVEEHRQAEDEKKKEKTNENP